jgi:predicted lipoprotein with Yx(FWY)xxD motif
MRHPRTVIAILGLSVAGVASGVTVAATAGGSTPSARAAAIAPAVNLVPTGQDLAGTTVHTAQATVGGATENILVDGNGFPLYFYAPDTTTMSMVSGELAALWPPLVASAPTISGAGGTLKVVDTSNGHQVAYNGHFLYTFIEDSPDQVTGQGVQDFFIATPGISSHPVASAPGSTAQSGNGY